MMAAITVAKNKHKVILLEKMGSIGNKLLITGKGRCNITNSADMDEFFKNIPGNSKFLYSAFNNFTNKDIVAFLESNGVETKIESGGRIFPVSDKSIDVLSAFKKKLKELNVEIAYNSRVKEIKVPSGRCEFLNYGQNYSIVLDYAHTTDAFNSIYKYPTFGF